jgi:hypothetical protein
VAGDETTGKPNLMISQERLKQNLSYDPETGVFIWLASPKNRLGSGDVAGAVHPVKGYRQIKVLGKLYLAHRLAWLYVYGTYPERQIDHINRNRDDNSIRNLREVEGFENMQNRLVQRNSKSGVKGVHWSKRLKRWIAIIELKGKAKHIGCFKTLHEAEAAYLEHARQLHRLNPFEGHQDGEGKAVVAVVVTVERNIGPGLGQITIQSRPILAVDFYQPAKEARNEI